MKQTTVQMSHRQAEMVLAMLRKELEEKNNNDYKYFNIVGDDKAEEFKANQIIEKQLLRSLIANVKDSANIA
jgi:NADH dehydrogenase FAD-containing subunit